MRPNITISIPEPYITLAEYCERHNMALSTARDMIRDGRLPVRGKIPKKISRGLVFINMAALTVEALISANVAALTVEANTSLKV